jgi:myo-inositol-1(or 4)-monophosphatase
MFTMNSVNADRPADPAELLALALKVVRPAAELARSMRGRGVDQVATKTTDTDIVTAADQAVERQGRAALAAVRPHDVVLGEEFGAEAGEAGAASEAGADGAPGPRAGAGSVRWILDPIDGTVNYLYGIPQDAVSLAAEVDGEVVAGVVHNAATGEEWTATRGGGAYLAGRRLTGSVQTRLSQALVATGFGYDAARRAHQARVVAGLITEVRDIRRFGSAAIDLCLAATGRVDAYFEKGLHEWDLAAGGLIATEAGLLVTGLEGAPPGIDLVLAAPLALHPALHAHLVKLDAAGGV